MANSTIFQQPSLSEPILRELLDDGAPQDISDEFWDLMGMGLDTALLEESDVRTLKLRIRIAIRNILMKYPEWEWDNLYITEIKERRPGEPPIIKKHKIYPDIEDKLINKICLVKGTRGKHGNLLEKLTTSNARVFSESIVSNPYENFMPQQQQNKKSGLLSNWRK